MPHVPEGWAARSATRLDETVGPFYFPSAGEELACGFLADERHGNRHGVVHGGVIATAFDVALGTANGQVLGHHSHVTIQLNIHFLDGMQIGEFAVIRSEVSRATRNLVFMRGVMTVGDRPVATADGVWKILAPPRAIT